MTASLHGNPFDPFLCSLEERTLLEASAGTGKTWNICALYLRMLLEKQLTVRQILVVTFTKAATAELKERIRSRLVEAHDHLRHGRGTDPLLQRLAAHLASIGIPADAAIRQLDLAIQSFDEAAILTIHSFAQRALKESPFAAGMPFATELTQDDSSLIADVVHDFWRARTQTGALPESLARYLIACKDSPEAWSKLVRRQIGKRGATLVWPALAASDAQERLTALFMQGRSLWLEESHAIKALLASRKDDFKKSLSEESLQKAYAACDTYFSAPHATKCRGAINSLGTAKLADGMLKGKVAPTHAFFEALQTLIEQAPTLIEEANGARDHARNAILQDLLRDAPSAVARAKREARIVSYDDLLANLFDALHHPETPWLAASLRTRFPVALIDEFQDTDPLQYAIFDRIYGTDPASLFFVGDPKQAIYSFRNADLPTYLHAKQSVTRSYTLTANQRSSADLIDAMNGLFLRNPGAFVLPGLAYHAVACGEKPRARFDDRSAGASTPAAMQVWMLPGEADGLLPRSTAMQRATQATAAEIARLIAESRAGRITLAGRPLAPGDIAVLVRSHGQAQKIRAALGAWNIASIEISQASVFASDDAEELERLLRAILEPAQPCVLLAGLATSLIGLTADRIAAISEDDLQLRDWIDRFVQYRELWQRRGVGRMARQFIASEKVSERLLCRPDGERRMTNLRHLLELLEQAAQHCHDPASTLRWLQSQRAGVSQDEAAQLRLESDRNLVQILTIHKSKGLEYPVVFCPYLFDAYLRASGNGVEGREYHDDDGRLVIDFRKDKDAEKAAKARMRREECAETLRLIYVALTRAAHRCYLVGGVYTRPDRTQPAAESAKGMLNWLVAGAGHDIDTWLNDGGDAQAIDHAWRAWVHNLPTAVALAPLAQVATAQPLASSERPALLAARVSAGAIGETWRIGSFSQLARHVASEAAASDHDERVDSTPAVAPSMPLLTGPEALAPDDILRFPRGPEAGNCLHALFEHADFTAPASWPGAIDRALREFPLAANDAERQTHAAMAANLLRDVVSAPLDAHGLRLASVPRTRRLTELEFCLPASSLTPGALNAFLARHGYDAPTLSFPQLQGYLRGFIDLVFESGGRYYILDWKSNHLGYTAQEYGRDGLRASMAEHGYHLQYLLYTVALHRYLSLRLPDYTYDEHFGGVYYLFIRGVRPGWTVQGQPAGVFHHRPDRAHLDALLALIDATALQEAA